MPHSNPFEEINARLSDIERLLIDIKHRPQEEVNNDFLTITEAARFLEISRSQIQDLVSSEEIPSLRRSGKVYISREELIEYLKKQAGK